MRSGFNFIQVANWLYICICNLQKIQLSKNSMTKEEFKTCIKIQKNKISNLIDILNKKSNIQGINNEFIKNLNNIKKEYGVEE